MLGMLAVEGAIGVTEIIALFIDALTALIPGFATILVNGFQSFAVTTDGSAFTLIAIWAVVLACFWLGQRLVFGLMNRITHR